MMDIRRAINDPKVFGRYLKEPGMRGGCFSPSCLACH